MLAFIKGYLVVSFICALVFLWLVKYDCEDLTDNDKRGWD